MDQERILARIREFRDARDWMQFHNPKNMAVSIVLEASELLEHFQWTDTAESDRRARERRPEIEEEVADIAIYLLELCDNLGIDLESAIHRKLDRNAEKYPPDRARGSSRKYNEL